MAAKIFATPISLKNQQAANKIPTAYILTVDPGKKPEEDTFFKAYQRAKDRGWFTEIMIGSHVVHIDQTANLVKLLEAAPAQAKPASTQ
jgi:hypothetical protein